MILSDILGIADSGLKLAVLKKEFENSPEGRAQAKQELLQEFAKANAAGDYKTCSAIRKYVKQLA